MPIKQRRNTLCFACDCVSANSDRRADPWTSIAKGKLLSNGTKEDILNVIADRPKTISQIAEILDLSIPSVHTHVREMLSSELIREALAWEKAHHSEHYYELNFPVVDHREAVELCRFCDELAVKFAALFKKHHRRIEAAFRETPLAEKGWDVAEVAQYVYASVQRNARELLEKDGALTPRKKHRNGLDWVFWAEKSKPPADR